MAVQFSSNWIFFSSPIHNTMNRGFTMATSSVQTIDLELLGSAARRAVAYLQGVRTRRVSPDAGAVRELEQLTGRLPEEGAEPWKLIDILDRFASPATVATTGGRYFGFVTGGAL